jgi:hypothetical protein
VIDDGKSGLFVRGQGQIHNPEHGASAALQGGTLPPGPARNTFHFGARFERARNEVVGLRILGSAIVPLRRSG